MREIHVIISHGNGVLQNNSYRVSNCCKKVCQQGFQILLLNSKEKKNAPSIVFTDITYVLHHIWYEFASFCAFSIQAITLKFNIKMYLQDI